MACFKPIPDRAKEVADAFAKWETESIPLDNPTKEKFFGTLLDELPED